MSDDYTCECCGGTFRNERSEADADAEALKNFGIRSASTDPDISVICENCYRDFMAWFTANDDDAA